MAFAACFDWLRRAFGGEERMFVLKVTFQTDARNMTGRLLCCVCRRAGRVSYTTTDDGRLLGFWEMESAKRVVAERDDIATECGGLVSIDADIQEMTPAQFTAHRDAMVAAAQSA
jgi:hypothetical protein